MAKVVFEGKRIAKDLGASSPKTICKTVITAKAIGRAILCAVCSESSRLKLLKMRKIIVDTTPSPIHPKPRLARVTPNWVAAR